MVTPSKQLEKKELNTERHCTHVPRAKHILKPMVRHRHCSKLGEIWWQSCFLPFSYPRPKHHPTLLMRKTLSHVWFPFPTSELLLNKTQCAGDWSHTPTAHMGASRAHWPLAPRLHTGSHWHHLIPHPLLYTSLCHMWSWIQAALCGMALVLHAFVVTSLSWWTTPHTSYRASDQSLHLSKPQFIHW